jgi:hypothetical protein
MFNAVRQGAASSITIAFPSAPSIGDLMLVAIGVNGPVSASLSGWTALDNSASSISQQTFYRVATSSDQTTYSYTFGASGNLVSAQIIQVTGQHVSAPINQHSSLATTSGSSPSVSTASLTPSVLGCLPLAFFAISVGNSSGGWTPSWTEIQQINFAGTGSCESQYGALTTSISTSIAGQVTLGAAHPCEAALILVRPANTAVVVTSSDTPHALSDTAGRQTQVLDRTSSQSASPISDSALRPAYAMQRASGDFMNGFPYIFMIGQEAISTILLNTTATALLAAAPAVYVILTTLNSQYPPNPAVRNLPGSAPFAPLDWSVIWVYRWTNEHQMAADCATPGLPLFIGVAMYDNELVTTPQTPQAETNDPPTYTGYAATLAQSARLPFIATGGLHYTGNLYDGAVPPYPYQYWATANNWDGYAIQSQTGINNAAQFGSTLSAQSASVLAVNASVTIFSVGVGDFASGTFASVPTIDATMATIPEIVAFTSRTCLIWMNFGGHSGVDCTDPNACPIPVRYDMIVSIINDLGTKTFL